jgi:hypothetical protein
MQSIADTLFSLYRGTPQHEEWVLACLGGAWQSLVGERLDQACRPVRFAGTCLTIEVTDPSYLEPLRSMEAEVRDRLRVATRQEVRQIRFRQTGG